MGKGWADGYLPRAQFEDRKSHRGLAPGTQPTCVYTASGRGGLVVDLLLDFVPKKAYDNLQDKAQCVEKALRKILSAGTDDVQAAFTRVAAKVRSFCPQRYPRSCGKLVLRAATLFGAVRTRSVG